MNTLGISLLWCVVQATLFTSVGLVVYYAARRRSPAMAAAAVASTLIVLAAVSALAFSPWPRWYTLGEVAPGLVPGASDAEFSANANGPATGAGATDAGQPATRAGVTAATDTRLADAWQFFWDELQLAQATDRPTTAARRWPGVVAAVFVLGVCLALGRVALGLLAVRRYRAGMLALTDPALLAQTARITQQMGCRRPVELRQSASLNTPATIGWRRPIVILPDDWRSWSETERQVVLAHEIAHIARGDYAAWLIAQLSVALHFYHPLVHWLARRLRLEQELAADAWAAALAGSRETYLMTLAQMALRQDDRAIAWAARGFLPTRGAFLRRIEMLRENKPLRSASLSRRRTAILMAVVAMAGLAIAGVRGPAGTSQAAPPKDATAKSTPGSDQRQNTFDLAYVPSRAVAVIALRPATMVGREGMKPLAEVINDNPAARRSGFRVENIEELKFAFTALPSGGPMMDRLIVQIFRSTEPFDWMKVFGKEYLGDGEPVTVQFAGKEYFKMAELSRQMDRTIYLPDDRTIVMATEPQLQQILLAGKRSPDWADRWQSLGSGEFAAMLDLTAVNQALAGELKQTPPPPHLAPLLAFAPLWEKGQKLFVTARLDDEVTLQARIDCRNRDDVEQVQRTAQAALTLAQNMLDELGNQLARAPAQGNAAALPAIDVASQLLKRGKLATSGESVEYVTKLDVDVAETATAIMTPAVLAARESAQRAQDMNNVKQIMLALHIYADMNKHFPPPVVIGPDGKTPHSWRVEILPFLEQEPLYRQYKMDEPWDSENNKKVLDQMPAVLRAPNAAPGSKETSYFALVGPTTFFGDKDSKGTAFMDVLDGTSNTIAVVEAKRSVPWTKPEDIDYDPTKPLPKLGGWHPGGFVAAFGDGSARFVFDKVGESTLRALITKAGGELIPQQ